MQELPFFLNFSEPTAWLIILWGAILAPGLYVALWRPSENESKQKNLTLRKAGFEVSFVIVPFAIYAGIYVVSSSLSALLNSPELPMAGLLLCFMSLRWVLVALKLPPERVDLSKVRSLRAIIVAMIILLVILIIRLVTAQFSPIQEVSSWYGVVNSALFIFSFYLAYGIIGAMMMFAEVPEELKVNGKSTSPQA